MTNIVDYVLNLKGNLAGGLSQATSQATQLESTLGAVKGIASAIGLSFAAYQGFAFVKEGVEKFHELEQVTAKVEANLTATGEKAGMSMEDLKTMAKDLSSKIQASRVDITDMQSQLLTFPSITKDVFNQSMGLVADIAKQTGHELKETAIMYGKALADPTEGLQKMQRYGVILSEQEKTRIKQIQASGDLIGAQKFMMDAIAHSGYAGVAEAMFNADPIARFNKLMGSAKLAIGEYVMGIIKDVMPALESFAGGVKDIVGFMKEHSTIIGTVLTLYATYKGIMIGLIALEKLNVFWKGLSVTASELLLGWDMARATGLGVLTSAQWALNLAMNANPIGLIVIGVAALITGIIALVRHFGSFGNAMKQMWEITKSVVYNVVKVFAGLGGVILGAVTLQPDIIKRGLDMVISATQHASREISTAWNNTTDNVIAKEESKAKKLSDLVSKNKITAGALSNATWHLSQELDAEIKKGMITKDDKSSIMSLIPKKTGAAGNDGKDGKAAPAPKTKAEGQKTINIHVAYNAPLIKDFTISTTNIQEGLGSLKEKVSAILVGATHDSLMVADY